MGIKASGLSTKPEPRAEVKVTEICTSKSDNPIRFNSDEALIEDSESNGFYLEDCYVPLEILTLILSHVPPKSLLKLTLVCKSWNKILKDNAVWIHMYKRKYPNRKPKQVPWYVYYTLFATQFFNVNLIKSANNFSDKYEYFLDDGFFSDYIIRKQQLIQLGTLEIHRRILNEFKPHILVSELLCSKFDRRACRMRVKVLTQTKHIPVKVYVLEETLEKNSNPPWKKMRLILQDYPEDTDALIFEHEGKDLSRWEDNYGSQMAGSVVKILFETMRTCDCSLGSKTSSSLESVDLL